MKPRAPLAATAPAVALAVGLASVCALGLALGFSAPAQAADGTSELGLELIPWSKKVGDKRYESPRDYEGTVKFYKDKFKGWKNIKWTREVSLPAVKYVHLETTSDNSKWQGVNIYELPDQRVRYYVLERPKVAPAAPATKPAPAAPANPGAKPSPAKPSTP